MRATIRSRTTEARAPTKFFIQKILRVSSCGSRFCADLSTTATGKFFEINIIAQSDKK
jgi:hypothetical protein